MLTRMGVNGGHPSETPSAEIAVMSFAESLCAERTFSLQRPDSARSKSILRVSLSSVACSSASRRAMDSLPMAVWGLDDAERRLFVDP